ncbi:uncharacterized protein LOC134837479 [Culicoides brevitarsis]|uniref:uncharacterized protein LOC134837479 n=1 Tax=Culicoides brevitarsis TaxID=469753 RepID=UPI00307BB6DC
MILLSERLEQTRLHKNTGNAATDFLNYVINSDDSKISFNFFEKYSDLNDTYLMNQLSKSFENFFEGRNIILQSVPGIVIKVVPKRNNLFQIEYKNESNIENPNYARADLSDLNKLHRDDLLGNKKYKGYSHYLEVGVPVLFFPAILFSSVLPFIIPALKMTTLFATMINNAALFAGAMFLARQTAVENEKKQTIYFNPGYNRKKTWS